MTPAMSEPAQRHKRPSMLLALTEPARAAIDVVALSVSRPVASAAKHGNGEPVLILPGFMAGDGSTRPLRAFLRSHDWMAYRWRMGRNIGPTPDVLYGISHSVASLSRRHHQPVALVGWSLGGLYARNLAIRHPELVSKVITLASPFALEEREDSNAHGLYQRLSDRHHPDVPGVDGGGPLGVPATSVYTKADGIVPWEACVLEPDHQSENVEVFASHIGLGFNPAVHYLIADRLSQPVDDWQPFDAPRWFPGGNRSH